jgi:hypothetical protein
MKKLIILTIASMACTFGFAQRSITKSAQPVNSFNPYHNLFTNSGAISRTTGIGDTTILRNISDTAALVIYTMGSTNDSGYLTGTNYLLDQGFAEHYYVNGNDSSLMVLGVFAQFGGQVSDTCTESVSFHIWDQSPAVAVTAGIVYNGFPSDILATQGAPFTQLGIGATIDTMKLFLFPSPTPIWSSFFAGYTINGNYTFSKSNNIGLASTADSAVGHDFLVQVNIQTYPDSFFYSGDTSVLTIDSVTDTTENVFINVRNATMQSDYNWYDNLTQNDSLRNHLAIYPLVAINDPTGLKSVTKDNLTFFGNYPNPAVAYTNIKFSLLKPDNVTILIMDNAGRIVNTIAQAKVEAGVHLVTVNTSSMPAGDYIYLIRTTSGDGMAGKMTVLAN